jgi:outer membrane protein
MFFNPEIGSLRSTVPANMVLLASRIFGNLRVYSPFSRFFKSNIPPIFFQLRNVGRFFRKFWERNSERMERVIFSAKARRFFCPRLLDWDGNTRLSGLYLKCLSCFFAILVLSNAPLYGQYAFSLDSCFRLARASHPTIGMAEVQMEQARFNLKHAHSYALPDLQTVVRTHNTWGLNVDPTTNELVQDKSFGTSADLELDMLVFGGFSMPRQQEVRKWELGLSQTAKARADRECYFRLLPVFFECLLQEEVSRLNLWAADSLETIIRRMERAKSKGYLTQRELLQLRFQQSEFQTAHSIAAAQLSAGLRRLNSLMGRPADAPLILKRDTSENHYQLLQLRDTGLVSHPSLDYLGQEIGKRKAVVQLSRAAYYPRLELYANIGTKTSSLKDGSLAWQSNANQNERIGLRLSYPVSSLWSVGKETALARFDLRSAELQWEAARLEISLQNDELWTAIQTCREKYLTRQKQVKLAMEEHRYARALLEVGEIPVSEFISSFSRLTKARIDFVGSLSDLQKMEKWLQVEWGGIVMP